MALRGIISFIVGEAFVMRHVWAIAVLLAACNCAGEGDRSMAEPRVAATNEASQTSATGAVGAAGVDVAGTLSPAIAPPASLVILEPTSGATVPIKAEPAVLDQAGYEFLPGFLIAQAGQVVQFRNSEDVLHNVRVTEASQQKPIFNVATTAFGVYEHKLEAGLYNVTCDIHPTMRATILVTASPYAASTGADGSFAITAVPPGPYRLIAYGSAAAPVERAIEVKNVRTELGVIQ
jgi:plastocyanin